MGGVKAIEVRGRVGTRGRPGWRAVREVREVNVEEHDGGERGRDETKQAMLVKSSGKSRGRRKEGQLGTEEIYK